MEMGEREQSLLSNKNFGVQAYGFTPIFSENCSNITGIMCIISSDN